MDKVRGDEAGGTTLEEGCNCEIPLLALFVKALLYFETQNLHKFWYVKHTVKLVEMKLNLEIP